MPLVFVILFVLLLNAGCSTSEVYRPVATDTDPGVSRIEKTALIQSEGVEIEAQLAREENGRLRVDLVVDNRSSMNIDLSLGDVHVICNGEDLKVHSTRFLRNWSYQNANRGTFAPSESAYATVSYESPGTLSGSEKLELLTDGITDSRTGRKVEFPRVAFGEPSREKRNYPEGSGTESPKKKS
jgi:hypothetical protein